MRNQGQFLRDSLRSLRVKTRQVSEDTMIPLETIRGYFKGLSPIPDCKLLLICLLYDLNFEELMKYPKEVKKHA